MSSVVNSAPFLRTSREFPDNARDLSFQANKAYLETANAVNQRTIGIYPETKPAITGNVFYLNNHQQTLRQVYTFTSTANIALGFKLSSIGGIVKGYGSSTDGTGQYGLIFNSSTAIAGQIGFYVTVDGTSTTSDKIVFTSGAGSPTLTSGILILEWLSNP